MIRYTLRRSPGVGRRYSAQDRALVRDYTLTGAPDTLSVEAVAAMESPDGIRTVVDVLFELESNRLARPTTVTLIASGAPVAPATGTAASLVDGLRVPTTERPAVAFPAGVTLASDPAVELTWTGGRTVNVVEVHGDPVVGQITDVVVDYRDATSGAWITGHAAGASPAGRLAVPFPAPVSASGVRVHVKGTNGPGGVALTEVDPMYVLDVSDDLETLDVEFARETDPGSSTNPTGSFEAGRLTLVLDDTAGAWNPSTNGALDVGHRVEVAVGVVYTDPVTFLDTEELLPAGVFYTEPYDTDSTSTTVTITAADKLGRQADVVLSEPVTVGGTVGDVVRTLAARYLDFAPDQVYVSSTVGDLVIPYAYPTGPLGTYLADLAKAYGATVHVSAAEQLTFATRSDVSGDVSATFTDSTNLLSFRRPPGYDVTTSVVQVTASPLTQAAVVDLWAMPSGGVRIPTSGTYDLVARYEDAPAVNGFVSGIVADGSYTVTAAAYYSDRAVLSIRNNETTRALVVADLRIRGNPLVDGSLTVRREDTRSVARYGPRTLDVEARLVQTQDQLELLADVVLDAFRSLDDEGNRRIPDVEFDALGLLYLTSGDRVALSFPDKGLSGEYTILGRRLSYANGALLLNGVRAREAPVPFLVYDVGLYDDVGVYGY